MKFPSFMKCFKRVPNYKSKTPADIIVPVSFPKKVSILLKQQEVEPCTPIVRIGDKVKRGQKIAMAQSCDAVPIHASISGIVTEIHAVDTLANNSGEAIEITASDEDRDRDELERTKMHSSRDWRSMSADEIIDAIAESGIVDLGKKPFSTAYQLSVQETIKKDILIIDALESNPYLTCNDALMRHHSPEIVDGIKIMMAASNISRAVVVTGKEMKEAYDALYNASVNDPEIKIQCIRKKNDKIDEKELVKVVTGKILCGSDTPIKSGVVVCNVATAFAVYRAVVFDMPFIEKMITVVGRGNFQVPIGINLSELNVDFGGKCEHKEYIILGGILNGKCISSLNAPVDKGISGVAIVSK